MRPEMVLIDGHAVAYRQYFALPESSFSTPSGQPTNAIFGFTRVLMDILQNERPQYLAVSFDMGLSGRDELFGDYKGTREKMPDALESQMEWIFKLVKAFNIPLLSVEGYEADDVIGTVTLQIEEEGVETRIITGDRDLLQLLTDHVKVQLPVRGESDAVYDVARFIEKYEIQPPQLVDLKALMGDSSDNIPGVKGIGQKGATSLILEYGSLDGIYENVEVIKGSNKKKLLEGREIAYISQKLAAIRRDVPVKIHLPDCVAHEFNVNDVLEIFDELNFRSLRNRLLDMGAQETMSMFGEDDFGDEDFAPPPKADQVVNTVIVRDEQALDELVSALNNASLIAWDVEASSTNQMAAEIAGFSFSVDGQTGYYVPVGHTKGKQLSLEKVVDAVRPALVNPTIPKAAHNASYDLVVCQRYGIDVSPVTFDTMIAEWLIDPLSKNLGLKNLAYARLRDEDGRGIWMTPITDLIGTGKGQITFNEVPIDLAGAYSAADSAMTYRLVEVLKPLLEEAGLLELYETLEMPLIPVIADMEQAGIVLDTAYLSEMSQRLDEMLKQIEDDINVLSGGYGDFNINSPKQLNDVLFGKLGLPTKGLKKTKFGYSTDTVTLDALYNEHEIIPKIVDYRELSKLKGTYVDALPALVNAHTGRVHTSYNQTGTVTGRISSSDPNLQNIPIRTEIGREVRRAFVAPKGKKLISVDYSQVELRILAHISRDPTLIEAFSQGQDIHQATAAAVFGIPLEQVTYEQRSFAKKVNFGIIYGMGAFRLARDSELSFEDAKKFIDTYFERLPEVQKYIDSTKRAATDPEGLKTLLGRRRIFWALVEGRSKGPAIQAEERAAINMPIQGTAADIIKKAMIDLFNAINREGLNARMILQVHDELVLEVPEDEVEEIKQLIIDVMENAYPLDPPLKANSQVGDNWCDMEA